MVPTLGLYALQYTKLERPRLIDRADMSDPRHMQKMLVEGV